MSEKSHIRILIVDDIPSTSRAIRRKLISSGFAKENVVQCNREEEAELVLTKSFNEPSKKYDIVIIDLYMEGDLFAGTKLCYFLKNKRDKEGKDVPKGIIYSRYREPYSIYLEKKQQNNMEKQIKALQQDGIVYNDLSKRTNHEYLLKDIEKLCQELERG